MLKLGQFEIKVCRSYLAHYMEELRELGHSGSDVDSQRCSDTANKAKWRARTSYQPSGLPAWPAHQSVTGR